MPTPPLDSLARHLTALVGGFSLPSSRLSKVDRRRLQSLFDSGVVEEARAGAGRRLVVTDPEALRMFIERQYPSGLEGFQGDIPPRSRSVAEFRDSKRRRSKGPETLLARGFNGCALVRADGARLPVAEWTALAGVAALLPDCLEGWRFRGRVALAENLEFFRHIEVVAPEIDLALYAEGRVSAEILTWLAGPVMAEADIVHFPDYDPVGMDEYLRLRRACPERTELYLPENLEQLFARYGKADLLTDSAAVLARLRKCRDGEVVGVVELMDRFGVGLEQEALLIGSPEPEL